jgi:S-DNA-T family DNA segregation ATPase FtsK/SpoIIIE
MAQASSTKKGEENPVFLILGYLKECALEFWGGVVSGRLPWSVCAGIATFLAIAFVMRWDAIVWRMYRVQWLYPFRPWLYWLYFGFAVSSSFLLWTIARVSAKRKLITELTRVFRNAGLQTAMGRLPGFIADQEIDSHMRKMTLAASGIPESEYVKARPVLEAELRIFIDQIKSKIERGTVELLYAHHPLEENVPYDVSRAFLPLQIQIGKTRSTPLYVSLKEVPHILVGGYTTGGKSSFLRQAVVTLVFNNPGVEFTLIDLKRGLEFQHFSGLKNVRVVIQPAEAIGALSYVDTQLEKRLSLLSANQCGDFDAFFRIPEEKRVYTPEWPKGKVFSRHVVVIDEAAQLFLAGDKIDAKGAQTAKRLAAKIAALGRAVGIHLIVATQRPDRHAVDPLIKANLQGRLCFQMADNASSMTILDSVRAADLPPTKGRAVWRSGMELTEVQVPWLDHETMQGMLEAKKAEQGGPAVQVALETPGRTDSQTGPAGPVDAIDLRDRNLAQAIVIHPKVQDTSASGVRDE